MREEEEGGAGGHVTVVYLSSLDEVTAIKQNGCMLPDDLMTVSKTLWEKTTNFENHPQNFACELKYYLLHKLFCVARVYRAFLFPVQAVDVGIESCLRLKHRMKSVLCT